MASDGGPATYLEWDSERRRGSHSPSEECAYEAGLAEGIRWECASQRPSKLDYFAAKAMQGLLTSKVVVDSTSELLVETDILHLSWKLAADMLAESEKRIAPSKETPNAQS